MGAPRWLADEMVGRLARYLRFLGYDTLYARGLADDEIVALARKEDRVVLTRDRELARRAPRALLLQSTRIDDQLRAVVSAYPDLALEPRFDRCTRCNGRLAAWTPPEERAVPEGARSRWGAKSFELYRCDVCSHVYWDGSHAARVRADVARWTAGGAP
jgi:uncharacterized protein